MKKIALAITLIAAAGLSACGGSEPATETVIEVKNTPELTSIEEKVSYLLGYNTIAQLENQGLDIEFEAFSAGLAAAVSGEESAIDMEQAQGIFAEYQTQMQEKAQAEFSEIAAENLARSQAFLTSNATMEGVVTTPSGLQYKVLQAADGEMPTQESTVQVHYEGRLISGDIFDSSIARGTPVEFALTQVIAGWTEGLQLMPEGARYEFYIPSDLAYGPGGSRNIGPNEALIFEVELIQANYVTQ